LQYLFSLLFNFLILIPFSRSCSTLYFAIRYNSILYYTILYYTILFTPNLSILFYSILCYTKLYFTLLYYTLLSWWARLFLLGYDFTTISNNSNKLSIQFKLSILILNSSNFWLACWMLHVAWCMVPVTSIQLHLLFIDFLPSYSAHCYSIQFNSSLGTLLNHSILSFFTIFAIFFAMFDSFAILLQFFVIFSTLYYTILYYTILFYAILHYAILYHAMQYNSTQSIKHSIKLNFPFPCPFYSLLPAFCYTCLLPIDCCLLSVVCCLLSVAYVSFFLSFFLSFLIDFNFVLICIKLYLIVLILYLTSIF